VRRKVTEAEEFTRPVLEEAVKMASRTLAAMPDPTPEPAPPTPEQWAQRGGGGGAQRGTPRAAARSGGAAGSAQRDVPRAPAARSALPGPSTVPPPKPRVQPRSKPPAARPQRGGAPAAARSMPRVTAPAGLMSFDAARVQLQLPPAGNRLAGIDYDWQKSVEALEVNPNPTPNPDPNLSPNPDPNLSPNPTPNPNPDPNLNPNLSPNLNPNPNSRWWSRRCSSAPSRLPCSRSSSTASARCWATSASSCLRRRSTRSAPSSSRARPPSYCAPQPISACACACDYRLGTHGYRLNTHGRRCADALLKSLFGAARTLKGMKLDGMRGSIVEEAVRPPAAPEARPLARGSPTWAQEESPRRLDAEERPAQRRQLRHV
jgi:hypothetical protein